MQDNDKLLEERKHQNPASYREAKDRSDRYRAWKETYLLDYATQGLFEADIPAYEIGKKKFTANDLKRISSKDTQSKHHAFATILRKYNVSGRENAFDKLVNLLLCKVVDETNNAEDLKFYWKGVAYDSPFDLQDRLQLLYKEGMDRFLGEQITYIGNEKIDEAFWAFLGDKDATKNTIKGYFKQLKFFTNNDFAFIEVHNEALFYQNAAVLRDIVRLFQDTRIKGDARNQFLGDMFEIFLDQGVKQSEGQFFTPMPITRFIIACLPLEKVIVDSQHPPRCLDYACGAGHFLNELASQIEPYVTQHKKGEIENFHRVIEGVEKEYRLSKVAKVSAFMYGQDNIKITYADALSKDAKTPLNSYAVLVANPPYSVKGFLETLSEEDREKYTLTQTVQNIANNNSIESFFIERAQQLLAGDGVAGIIFPSSILSNADATYTAAREILLKYFDIVAIGEFGSGTFGKTGTNTVTLFLRRRAAQPQPADHYRNRVEQWFTTLADTNEAQRQGVFADEHFIKKYCHHIGVECEDYKTLLLGDANQDLMQTEMFDEYKKAFDKLSGTVQRKNQKSFKDLDPIDQAIEMRKKLMAYIQGIEKEKLYYFVLASINPGKVIIVKSPSGTKEAKEFLGYEWSNAKGNEGIKLTTDAAGKHITPLYDEDNPRNPDKINYHIERAFLGETADIPEHLQPFVTPARLVDMLDFTRTDFNKQLSLSPERIITIESKWELAKLGEITLKVTESINPQEHSGIINYIGLENIESNTGNLVGNIKTEHKDIKSLKTVFRSGDILYGKLRPNLNKVYLTKENGICSTDILVFRFKDEYLARFCFQYFSSKDFNDEVLKSVSGVQLPRTSWSSMAQIKIPVPPMEVQQKIVQECEAVDADTVKAQLELKVAEESITTLINKNSEKEYEKKKLSSLCSMQAGKFVAAPDIQDKKEGDTYPCYGGNGLRGYTKTFTHEGTFSLIGRQGALCGNVKKVSGKFHATEHAIVVNASSDIDVDWLYHQLKALNLNQYATGVAQPGLSVQKLLTVTTPAPPLEEQKQLIVKINVLEAVIQAAQAVMDGAAERKAAIVKKYL
ncbi:N-6 DNA methylase [Thiothrix lacustris]|uniref:N-6 DNA methylase n=1 Tax=Thiothrix lacustris TaxID=525917 RepID=A0ABY9MU78_9GAMM|nr:N-6 DNA methylase [Thiothrix lacustris]WML92219.1 N-6 DNA methylase [Thiothrix lacustris]